MVMDGKTLQEYPVNAGVLQGSILGPTLLQLLICEVALNLYKSNLPQGQAWNIFVMSGVVLIC